MTDTWAGVVGQPDAVARLRAAAASPVHAYLFVGPAGSGKRAAARAFAAELFAADATDPVDAERQRRLALAEHHPDLVMIEPEGAIFRGGRASGDADTETAAVIREAYRSPIEASRKVIVAVAFHTANDNAVGALLKTLEEPPERSVLVLLADQVAEGHAAIESRCVRIDFRPLVDDVLHDQLVTEGFDAERASEAVALAGGDLDRARLLAADDRLQLRLEAWRGVPQRLQGTGASATDTVDDLRAMIDDALAPVVARHEADLAAFDEEAERYGQKGISGRRNALKTQQRRVERRFRTAELMAGLATLARAYRDEAAVVAHPGPVLESLDAIQRAAEDVAVNPNEELLLYALFVKLLPLRP